MDFSGFNTFWVGGIFGLIVGAAIGAIALAWSVALATLDYASHDACRRQRAGCFNFPAHC